MTSPTDQAAAAKDRAAPALMARAGVVGVGLTLQGDRPAIQILISERKDELVRSLPREIEGHPVVIETVGTIRAS